MDQCNTLWTDITWHGECCTVMIQYYSVMDACKSFSQG